MTLEPVARRRVVSLLAAAALVGAVGVNHADASSADVTASAPASSPSSPSSPSNTTAQALLPATLPTLPARLRGLGSARQVVVVTDPRGTSRATLTAYQKVGSAWRRVLGPVAARIGQNGFTKATTRVQGSQTTPEGSFVLGPSFGNGRSPGTRMGYREVDSNDRWVYDRSDPGTYNTYQPSGDWSNQERLSQIAYRQYRYSVVIGFNHPVMSLSPTARPQASAAVSTRVGGGIFLHVTKLVDGVSQPTAGCVSVAETHMRSLLRWLDPAKHPRIVMGRRSSILTPLASAATSVQPRSVVSTSTFGVSRGGRPLTVVRLGAVRPTHRLVVIGVIHGNEREGLRVVSRLKTLPLPAGLAVWLVPTMNPDGVAADARVNAGGVDLNRNFRRAWVRANEGTSRYSGPRAASEPETRAVEALLSRVDPNLVVIFHSPLNGVDTYGAKSPATVRALAAAAGFRSASFDCSGGCHGTLTQWFNHAHPGSHGQAITFEFGASSPRYSVITRVARALVTVAATAP